jgi:hypothetical protein
MSTQFTVRDDVRWNSKATHVNGRSSKMHSGQNLYVSVHANPQRHQAGARAY